MRAPARVPRPCAALSVVLALALLGSGGLGPAAPAVFADDPPPEPQGSSPDAMAPANRAAAILLAERLRRDRPEECDRLRRLRPDDLLVVRGAYDHLEWVLRGLDVPFAGCGPESMAAWPLRGVRAVLVNCPGRVGPDGARRLARFVDRGGFLLTTDWAVLHVLEEAFPGTVRFTRRPTRDDVVPIRVVRPEHLFLRHVLTGDDRPLWWVENQSYPIEILDPRRVEVLLESDEMARRYGSGPIAVAFRWGRGRVVHMVSHAYLQRGELRTPRDRLAAGAFAGDLGFGRDSDVVRRLDREGLGAVPAGEVRSAYAAQQMLVNLLLAAVREAAPDPDPRPDPRPEPRPEPRPPPPPPDVPAAGAVAARETALRDAPGGSSFRAVAEGLALRILERRGDWTLVSTPAGTTGWLRADEVREARR